MSLTTAQRKALKQIKADKVRVRWDAKGQKKWFLTEKWEALNPMPYRVLLKAGLIQVSPPDSRSESDVTLTQSGKNLLPFVF